MRWSLPWPGWSILLFISPVIFSQSPDDTPDYRKIFDSDYEYALEIIEQNSWWTDSLQNHSLDAHFALSVIFPELIRYSSISDYIEVKALEVLYVQYGRDYADFSVGLFQMKPSFAERIEADLLGYRLTESFPSLSLLNPDTTNNLQSRKARILRLKDEKGQLLYLEAFIRIIEMAYSDLTFQTAEDKLVFYAAAYNTGYWKGDQSIRRQGSQAYFYVGMAEPEVKYVYAGIAVDYFQTANQAD